MPTKNSVKTYIENSYYHVYNRGVEKRNIFLDDYDYSVFLNLIKIYLSPFKEATSEMASLFPKKRIQFRKTFNEEIKILALCLMPNHFHLLLYQTTPSSMTEFVRSLCTSYTMYFNKRHKRVGSLFQGIYKAVNVSNDEYLLHLSRYIHRNPLKLLGFNPSNLMNYPYSSLSTYLNLSKRPWINTEVIHEYFKSDNKSATLAYKEFVEMLENEDTLPLLNLILEDE